MSTTIESLELEVQSSASSATGGIDALSASLSRLKNAVKGGVGLTSVANQLHNLNTALQSMHSSSADKIERLANSLSKLSGLGSVRISASIGNQLRNIGSAVSALGTVNFSGLSRLSTALAPLNSLSRAPGLQSAITQLNKLPQLAQTLNSIDWDTFTQQIQRLFTALTPLVNQLNTVATAFSRLPANIQRVVTATNALPRANNRAAISYVNLWARCHMVMNAVRGVARTIASWITQSNSYIENVNLFNASMGKYAEEARKYAETIGELMGIDPGEWMRNQGVFMTITEGFGVATERAYVMSQQLTQLGYDLSSFFNISFEDAMQKLQSGISGELEPLRRLGYDLSQARLQAVALSLGIDKAFSKMTQAEKAQLRYYAIMTQVTTAQGDMARTLNAPANQLRVLRAQVTQCARDLGNIFIPALNAVLPYAIALAKVIRLIASAIAAFFDFELPEVDYSGITAGADAVAGSAADTEDGLNGATKAAKKLKNALLGIDELNIISPNDDSSGGGDGSGLGVGGGDLGFELPTYDFLGDFINNEVDEIVDKMIAKLKELLPWIAAIGTGFAAWEISKGLVAGIEKLKGLLKGFNGVLSFGTVGLLGFLSDMNEFRKFFENFQANGATFWNVGGMVSEFVGMMGDALSILGSLKIGSALKIIQGIGEIAIAVKDIADNGVNWENARMAIRGISNIAIGIGVFMGNAQGLTLAGVALVVQGMLNVINEVKNIINAVKTGDWESVDWVNLVVGALGVIGGLVIAISAFKKIKGAADIANAASEIADVTSTTASMSTATDTLNATVGSGGLTSKLTELVKNLALGIAIIAEVVVAALLIAGAIILLGMELEQVGIAWQPVIDNGGTVTAATGVGIGVIAAIGAVTYLLGTAGTMLIVNLALGIAVLAELGVAAGLFIAEIWAIGWGLDQIGQAWQPVLDNGETIKAGIVTGTELLIAIGVVTAALGMATVASAGSLPLAIGLGTALLVELSVALITFTESLVDVADELSDNLSPALNRLNVKLPTLSTSMSNFVDFMTEFADHVVAYTKVSSISALSATIDTIIGWFTQDPIDKLAKDVGNVYEQTSTLNEKLNSAVPELEEASGLLKKYQTFLQEIETLTTSNPDLSKGQFVNMKEVGQKIVEGFVDGIKSKSREFINVGKELVNGFKDSVDTASLQTKSSIIAWATNLKNWFTQNGNGAINKTTWQNYSKDIVTGFNGGVTNNYSSTESVIKTWGRNTVIWLEKPFGNNITIADKFKEIGKYVVQGFIDGIDSKLGDTRRKVEELAKLAQKAAEAKLKIGSPSRLFRKIGGFVVEGFNIGISNEMANTYRLMRKWLQGVNTFQPRLAFAVDTSVLSYYDPSSFQAAVSAESHIVMDDYSNGMEEAMRNVLRDYRFSQLVDDVRRQADKDEQTIVQVGDRTITDVVERQRKANGYKFA